MRNEMDLAVAEYTAGTVTIDTLLTRLQPHILRYVRSIDERVEPDDVTQVVLMDIWKAIQEQTDPSAALVLTIARRRTIDAVRQLKPAAESYEELSDIPSASENEHPEIDRVMLTACAVLGDQVVSLLKQGHTLAEISAITGIPAETIRTRQKKVRKIVTA